MIVDSRKVGRLCKEYRKEFTDFRQIDVGLDLGYSQENIASYEQGRNNNFTILLWYINQGLDIDMILKECISFEDD